MNALCLRDTNRLTDRKREQAMAGGGKRCLKPLKIDDLYKVALKNLIAFIGIIKKLVAFIYIILFPPTKTLSQ